MMAIPASWRISRPRSLIRDVVHGGSHTSSTFTSLTSGSCSRRSRMSHLMKSVHGQAVAVNVSRTATSPLRSCAEIP